jgi:hypothetical protein
VYAAVFPALFSPIEQGQSGETLLADTDASCFYHPGKKAKVICEGCGRFLCSLCDVEISQQHLCPACIESGKKKGGLSALSTRRTLHDDLAISLALLPLLIPFLGWLCTIATAPLAIWISIRHWKTPCSIVPRSHIRYVLAIAFGLLQLIGWMIVLILIVKRK